MDKGKNEYISLKKFIEKYIPKCVLKHKKDSTLYFDKSIKEGKKIVDEVRRKFSI